MYFGMMYTDNKGISGGIYPVCMLITCKCNGVAFEYFPGFMFFR